MSRESKDSKDNKQNIKCKVVFSDAEVYIDIKQSTFPAGERYIKLTNINNITRQDAFDGTWVVTLFSASSDAIMDAILCSNAIKEHFGKVNVIVNVPYFPYSRQDRACSEGESNSFKIVQDLLLTHFDNIVTVDIHNEKVIGDRVTNIDPIPNFSYVDVLSNTLVGNIDNVITPEYTVVVPDKGAVSRSMQAQYFIGSDSIIFFDKHRENGDIIITPKTEDDITIIKSRTMFVIFDDICDGGGTFIGIAKQILMHNPICEIVLVVSHGIFSNGLDVLRPYFNAVFVPTTDFNLNRREHI